MAKKLNILILCGGRSGEHEVSIVSALSIFEALDSKKYNKYLIGIQKSGLWQVLDAKEMLKKERNVKTIKLPKPKKEKIISLPPYPLKYLSQFKKSLHKELPKKIDVIFPVLHGTYGEDGTIQGLLELSQIPFVGSSVLGSAIGMDKDVTKRLLKQAGINVVPWITLYRHEYEKDPNQKIKECVETLRLPFFVKPANAGSSVGVHKVKSIDEAKKFIDDAFKYDVKVLVEKAIPARELEVSVLGNYEPQASTVGEIIPTHEFYSFEAKYVDPNGAYLEIPVKNCPQFLIEEIKKTAVKAFRVLECLGLCRVDFFLDKNTNTLYLNEVNTMPGFTSISMYPKLWGASQIKYQDLLDRLIELALERAKIKSSLKVEF
jgi:D-alanine-D-alanine ligase